MLHCQDYEVWVNTEVLQPIEKKISKTIQKCKRKKCKKWCLCCNKWGCWLETAILTIVEFIVTVVLQAIVYAICVFVDSILEALLRLLKALVCVIMDFGFSLFGASDSSQRVEHIFVLMLENRSFDHMFGLSKIGGVDAGTGKRRQIDGLTGGESNLAQLTDPKSAIQVSGPAEFAIPGSPKHDDPAHEFADVYLQLNGYAIDPAHFNGHYPEPVNTGFVVAYEAHQPQKPERAMHCFLPEQLPVLTTLAREFALCDRWFSSLPGPTWPNRYFVHGASSAGLDDSPSQARIAGSYLLGFVYSNGSIYDRLDGNCLEWEIFEGDETPQVFSIRGMSTAATLGRFTDFDEFEKSIRDPDYAASYIFIEPNYGNFSEDFACGNSQHPLDDVTRGELLVKTIYEAIRNSPHWEHSLLIITWDEHGGFFDHVIPPQAAAPGDAPGALTSTYGFDFQRLGVRVPALIISPLIPRNTLDGTLYDHASVPATLERNFGLDPLTNRDAQANDVLHLLSLKAPRQDTPTTLPSPANSGLFCGPAYAEPVNVSQQPISNAPESAAPPEGSDEIPPDLVGFLHVAFLRHYELTKDQGPRVREALVRNFQQIRTKSEARQYIESVRAIVKATRPEKLKTPPSRLTRKVRSDEKKR